MAEGAFIIYLVFWGALSAAVAATLTSFAGVVGERAVFRRPPTGRSRCVCGVPVRASDNIPVVGWLRLRGRARCCGAPIPPVYVRTESAAVVWSATSAVAAGVAADAGWAVPSAGPAGLAAAVVAACVGGVVVARATRTARPAGGPAGHPLADRAV